MRALNGGSTLQNRVVPFSRARNPPQRRLSVGLDTPFISACPRRRGKRPTGQRAELEAWLKRHRLKAVQWFEDRDSATNMQRDAFQKLQAAIFAGKVTTVVVWKLDRLARSLKEGVNMLADWCKRGVRVIAVTQQIDLSGPVGHLIASLLFGIAEIELQHVKERQAIGIAVARKRGIYTSTPAGRKAPPKPHRRAPAP
jgi:DNA invertase Pin-like site-specific DNA recombinase